MYKNTQKLELSPQVGLVFASNGVLDSVDKFSSLTGSKIYT